MSWLRRLLVRLANRIADADRPAPLYVPDGVTATITLSPCDADDPGNGILIRGKFAEVAAGGHLTLICENRKTRP